MEVAGGVAGGERCLALFTDPGLAARHAARLGDNFRPATMDTPRGLIQFLEGVAGAGHRYAGFDGLGVGKPVVRVRLSDLIATLKEQLAGNEVAHCGRTGPIYP